MLIADMPVSEDLKRGRFGEALKDLGDEKGQIIRLLTVFLAEYVLSDVVNTSGLENTSEEDAPKVLQAVATLLVDESSAKDFAPILLCINEDSQTVFRTVPNFHLT
jgi:hypothetical protein